MLRSLSSVSKLIGHQSNSIARFSSKNRRSFALDLKVSGTNYPANTNMWKSQPNVPKLPIPTLQETADRYIEFVSPLITQEQLQTTKSLVNDFIKKGGEGEKLQVFF